MDAFTSVRPLPANATRIPRRPQVEMLTGLARATIYAAMADGRFPRQVKFGGRSVGWIASEIEEWIAVRRPYRRRAQTRSVARARQRAGRRRQPGVSWFVMLWRRFWRPVIVALLLSSTASADAPTGPEYLTCSEAAHVEIENVAGEVQVQQVKPDTTYEAYLVVDRSRSRAGAASSVYTEIDYADIWRADETTVRWGGSSEMSTGVWALDLKTMNALYSRALTGGENPAPMLMGKVSGKMVYYRCRRGWPAAMLQTAGKADATRRGAGETPTLKSQASWWCATNFFDHKDQICARTREGCEGLNNSTSHYQNCFERPVVTVVQFTLVNGGEYAMAFPFLSQCQRARAKMLKNRVDYRNIGPCSSSTP
jgi:prophage regulatory protein